MTSNNWLALFILSVLGVTGYILVTRPKQDDDDGWSDLDKDWWG